ncbi:CBS domain-containing protein CBSX5-like [Phoenix dactylifera]|uniref:CBS domain-containing protein CBSX5-like n=1 Tax=Phoenix dactylifera TaxID=42345 RepID=A0A8B7CU18_PHODC|nr:CBS domain-containing protein CBSX5-like [Phoenix dactylifera]
MAVSFLSHEVSDLCIGKPALKSLPLSATAGDALLALKKGGDTCLGVWATDRFSPERNLIAGKLCVVDILCFLCGDENLDSPADALKKPVSNLLQKDAGLVRRVESDSSVLEALDVILDGAQNLVVPIRSGGRRKLHHHSAGGGGGGEFCWLTQEDFVRYFFNSIAHFAPIAAHSVSSLRLVRSDVLAIQYDDAALNALPLIRRALADQTSVAVITDDGKLVGEISPSILAASDETVAAAFATLSAGDLMDHIDHCGSLPETAMGAVMARLKKKGLKGMLELLEAKLYPPFSSPSSSSDEESSRRPRRLRSAGSYARGSEDVIVCHPESSLAAVMVQALARRVNYVWVLDEEDYGLVGIVTFADVLKVFRDQLKQTLL